MLYNVQDNRHMKLSSEINSNVFLVLSLLTIVVGAFIFQKRIK